jgi:hypothetical protein
LVVRDYLVTQQVALAVLTNSRDWLAPRDAADAAILSEARSSPARFLEVYARRALFTVGFLPAFEPEYKIRPHWLLAWAAFLGYLVQRLGERRAPAFWEAMSLTYLLTYVAPLVAVAAIGNYGFRMLVPAIPVLLALAVVFAARLAQKLLPARWALASSVARPTGA